MILRDFFLPCRPDRRDYDKYTGAGRSAAGLEELQEAYGRAMRNARRYRELELQLGGYRLTTAEILYHMPDHPGLLQTYIWQDLDLAPRFPVLKRFLDFWQREIEGPIHSVKVAHNEVVSPGRARYCDQEFRLH